MLRPREFPYKQTLHTHTLKSGIEKSQVQEDILFKLEFTSLYVTLYYIFIHTYVHIYIYLYMYICMYIQTQCDNVIKVTYEKKN